MRVHVCVRGGRGTERESESMCAWGEGEDRERELILSSCTLLQTITDCVAGYLGEVLLIWCAN